MLILRRLIGQRIEIIHADSEQSVGIVVKSVKNNQVELGFDDSARNFEIIRAETLENKPRD